MRRIGMVCMGLIGVLGLASAAQAQTMELPVIDLPELGNLVDAGAEPEPVTEPVKLPQATSDAALVPIRVKMPSTVVAGGLNPKGFGVGYSYNLTPQWAIGGHLGAGFMITGSLYGRYYFSEKAGSPYFEAIAAENLAYTFGNHSTSSAIYQSGGTSYDVVTPSFSALIGWENRLGNGTVSQFAGGLGLVPWYRPDFMMALLCIEFNLGTAF